MRLQINQIRKKTKLIQKKWFFKTDQYASKINKKVFIPLLVVITGQKCTLRCKDCGNFTPFLPQEHYKVDQIISDIEKLKHVARVSNLQIQGGEVLIYPDLTKLLVRLNPISRYITIATNGTRVLSQDQIDVIKSVGANLRISNYGISRQRSTQLISQCKNNNIPYRLYHFANGSGDWLELGDKNIKKSSITEAESIFNSCPFRACFTLENGLIARCSRSTVAHHVQHYTPNTQDHLHIRKIQTDKLRSELKKYYNRKWPLDF